LKTAARDSADVTVHPARLTGNTDLFSRRAHSDGSTLADSVAPSSREVQVDFIFLLALIVLYAATRWLIGAVSRLGGLE
jgi:hypothetical protein